MEDEVRQGEREPWPSDHAAVSNRKKKKKTGEVRRSEVEVWRVRRGQCEEAEWKDRPQPTDAMTQVEYESPIQNFENRKLHL